MISFHSVENPFDTEKDCYKNEATNVVYIENFKKDLKCNGTRYTAKLLFTDNPIVLPDNYF